MGTSNGGCLFKGPSLTASKSNVDDDEYKKHIIDIWSQGSDMSRVATICSDTSPGIFTFYRATHEGVDSLHVSHGAITEFIYSSGNHILGNLSTNASKFQPGLVDSKAAQFFYTIVAETNSKLPFLKGPSFKAGDFSCLDSLNLIEGKKYVILAVPACFFTPWGIPDILTGAVDRDILDLFETMHSTAGPAWIHVAATHTVAKGTAIIDNLTTLASVLPKLPCHTVPIADPFCRFEAISPEHQEGVHAAACSRYGERLIAFKTTVPVPKLGILRLDYNYPPAVGDIDHPESFDYPVIYRVIPGLTFEMCQTGDLTDEVKIECRCAVQYLERQGVSGITGDCGFMIHIQNLISDVTNKPVFMTSLVQLPSLCMCFDSDETIAVFTANSDSLSPLLPRLLEMCALREKDKERIQLVGCQDVDGFEAVEKGEQVDVLKVEAGIVALAKRVIEENPRIKAILLECTELPAYADSLKFATGLPVYDSISVCNSFMAGFLDNPKIGLNDFQDSWDGIQEEYSFGACLTKKERAKLVSKIRRSVRLSIIVNKLRSAVSAE